jgi:HPt (histidine-containing phosphotransfer) domain-containing protein
MQNPSAPALAGANLDHRVKNSAPLATVLDATALAGLNELDPTGKNRLVERVFEAFKTSAARLQPKLVQAGAEGDLAGVRHVVHTLKSSSASVGGLALSRLCADLETRVRDGNAEQLDARVAAVDAEISNLLLALEAWRAHA